MNNFLIVRYLLISYFLDVGRVFAELWGVVSGQFP